MKSCRKRNLWCLILFVILLFSFCVQNNNNSDTKSIYIKRKPVKFLHTTMIDTKDSSYAYIGQWASTRCTYGYYGYGTRYYDKRELLNNGFYARLYTVHNSYTGTDQAFYSGDLFSLPVEGSSFVATTLDNCSCWDIETAQRIYFILEEGYYIDRDLSDLIEKVNDFIINIDNIMPTYGFNMIIDSEGNVITAEEARSKRRDSTWGDEEQASTGNKFNQKYQSNAKDENSNITEWDLEWGELPNVNTLTAEEALMATQSAIWRVSNSRYMNDEVYTENPLYSITSGFPGKSLYQNTIEYYAENDAIRASYNIQQVYRYLLTLSPNKEVKYLLSSEDQIRNIRIIPAKDDNKTEVIVSFTVDNNIYGVSNLSADISLKDLDDSEVYQASTLLKIDNTGYCEALLELDNLDVLFGKRLEVILHITGNQEVLAPSVLTSGKVYTDKLDEKHYSSGMLIGYTNNFNSVDITVLDTIVLN